MTVIYRDLATGLGRIMFPLRLSVAAIGMWLCTVAAVSAAATNSILRADHPQNYTVQQGDTLWDISARFLRDPWRWPQIWRGNPQVRDPNLIYPGDVLYLSYDENGSPVLRMSAEGRPVIKLSPRARVLTSASGAIPVIPVDAIHTFLSRPRVVGADQLEESPYIVSLGKEHIVGGPGSVVYARGLRPEQGQRFTVFREGDAYVDPDAAGEILGYEATHIGDAVLTRGGDPSTLLLTTIKREVLVGDRILPANDPGVEQSFYPHAPDKPVKGSIISVVEGVTQIGLHAVVVLNLGKEDGIKEGSVLAVFQRGTLERDLLALDPNAQLPEPDAEIEFDFDRQRGLEGFTMAMDRMVRDIGKWLVPPDKSYQNYKLPDERAGSVMVFRAFDNLSYALVMEATRAMNLEDAVANP